MKIIPSQNKRLHKLLTDTGNMVDKPNLVWEFTNGRTTHSSGMETEEAASLIKKLQMEHTPGPSQEGSPPARPGNQIRRSIMSMSYSMGIINKGMGNAEKVAAIDQYVADHPKTGIKKPLNELNVIELQKLHYQFERFMINKMGK